MNKAGEENRSVRNTKRRLRDGLLQLLDRQPINEISFKELTELVDVNRGTFYFHYQDIFDLLHSIETDFFEQFDLRVSVNPETFSDAELLPYLNTIFSFVGENQTFCRIMLGPHGDMQFVERVKNRIDAQCSHFWQELFKGANRSRYEAYNAFIINGCVGVIQQWLNTGGPMTIDDITQLAVLIIKASVIPCIAEP